MAFKVTLNGANYVSDERQAAFERSLESTPRRTQAQPGGNGGNGHPRTPKAEAPAAPTAAESPLPEVHSVAEPAPPAIDPARVLEGLEWGLARSYDHQSEMLQVHQHYLTNEATYASIFAQLMREQSGLFAHGAASDAVARVLETLSRSMEQFHQHQSETLSAHSQFLAQQAAYAESFVDVLRHQYGAALSGSSNGHGNGNGNGNGGNGYSKPAPYRATPASAVAPPTPLPQQRLAPAPLPTRSEEREPAASPAAVAPQAASPVMPAAVPSPVVPAADTTLSTSSLGSDLLAIVSEKTGYPAEMLELEMDMEADLGIDSIKRVEILGALQDMHPGLPEVETDALAELRTLAEVVAYTEARSGAEPVAETVAETADTADTRLSDLLSGLPVELLAIVSEKTGYPAEMLELEMDMEADLGIDSIKRVEILGALQDLHPELPEVETDALAELRTLAQVLGYVQGRAAPSLDSATESTSQAEAKKA